MKYPFIIFLMNFLPQYPGKSLSRDGSYPKAFEDVKKEIAARAQPLAVFLAGITAEVLVVASFDELRRRAREAKGRIVVYNEPFLTYGQSVQYRSRGAVEAARAGALASLVRSVASLSISSPHTGWQNYQPDVPQIPTACISVEDAEMMSRMSLRGTKIVVYLKLGAKTYPDAPSFNTVAEIVGSKFPEQYNAVLWPGISSTYVNKMSLH
uniref:Carboxypeptidase Q n=1 Tax=Nothoprocta perdicaria TaxID=30464 RepID=A0A8C7A2A4_NOTPE